MEQAAVAFIEGDEGFAGQFVESVKGLEGPISDFDRVDEYLRGDPALINHPGLLALIEDLLRRDIQVYIEQPEYVSQKDDLWQSLFALTSILGYRTHLLDEIIMTLVVCELIERIARGDKILETTEGILEAARATIILPPEIFPLPPGRAAGVAGRRKAEWIEPYAIGDLQIVRQRLLTYTLGEVASIESILRSERKETTHRKLRRVEESTGGENIRLEESEADLHGTRADLLNETQKTIAQDSITTTFCNFSTTYGPPAVATLDGSWNVQNNPQSPHVFQARRFAQDITTRTTNRMARRVSETRTVKTLDEAESTSVHAFDNTAGASNVIGIYRWVNKIYRAHVVSYGHRLLIEFMISDPAQAYIRSEAQLQGLNLDEPVPPGKLPPPVGGIHSYKDITRANYAALAALYGVREIMPPPPEFQLRATSFQGGAAVNIKEIAIPEGYRAVEASVTYILTGGTAVGLAGIVGSSPFTVPPLTGTSSSSSNSSASGTPAGRCTPNSVSSGNVTTGTQCLLMNGEDTALPVAVMLTTSGGDGPSSSSSSSSSSSGSSGCGGLALNPYVPGELAFTNDAWDLGNYFVTIQARCALTAENFAEWQITTYDAILQGYQKQKGEYYARTGSGPTGRAAPNPLASREIEKSELKKGCMRLLSERYFELVGGALGEDGGPPQIAVDAPRYSQFFEQAFEWNEMTYTFYSRVEIPGLVREAPAVSVWPGNDPLFTSFLEAGAASVMLPVKPDYDLIILYYLSSGMIWDGANALTPTVDEYVSIVNELKTVSMTVERPAEDGNGWDILVPTSMTMLQAKPTLPYFKPVPHDR